MFKLVCATGNCKRYYVNKPNKETIGQVVKQADGSWQFVSFNGYVLNTAEQMQLDHLTSLL